MCVARHSQFAPRAHRFQISSGSHTRRTFQRCTMSSFPLPLTLGGTRQGQIDDLTRIAMRLGELNLRRLFGENLTAIQSGQLASSADITLLLRRKMSRGNIHRHNARKVCGARHWRTQSTHQLRINSRRRLPTMLSRTVAATHRNVAGATRLKDTCTCTCARTDAHAPVVRGSAMHLSDLTVALNLSLSHT